MRASVVYSDNDATDRLVDAGGGLHELHRRLEVSFGLRMAAPPTWGRFKVTEDAVAGAYRALVTRARAGDAAATSALDLMRQVPERQTFGVRETWQRLTGQPPERIGVKAGWDLSEDEPWMRTHIVVVDDSGAVAAAMTAVPIDDADRVSWQDALTAGGPEAVLPIHEHHAGELLRSRLSHRR